MAETTELSRSSRAALGHCMAPYCQNQAVIKTRRHGVPVVLCETHAKQPIKCYQRSLEGCSVPCANYGPGCP